MGNSSVAMLELTCPLDTAQHQDITNMGLEMLTVLMTLTLEPSVLGH